MLRTCPGSPPLRDAHGWFCLHRSHQGPCPVTPGLVGRQSLCFITVLHEPEATSTPLAGCRLGRAGGRARGTCSVRQGTSQASGCWLPDDEASRSCPQSDGGQVCVAWLAKGPWGSCVGTKMTTAPFLPRSQDSSCVPAVGQGSFLGPYVVGEGFLQNALIPPLHPCSGRFPPSQR